MTPLPEGRRVTLVAAYANNRVIGHEGSLPWIHPEDLRHFREITMGQNLVMGRKTFESIGYALPGRNTTVVSRNNDWRGDGVTREPSVEVALAATSGDVFVVGGEQIYREAFPYATHQILTVIHEDHEGDAFYPEFNEDEWSPYAHVTDGELDWRWLRRTTRARGIMSP